MSEAQLTELIGRVASGEGVEAILASMGIDSNIGCNWLKKHADAAAQIAAAKEGRAETLH